MLPRHAILSTSHRSDLSSFFPASSQFRDIWHKCSALKSCFPASTHSKYRRSISPLFTQRSYSPVTPPHPAASPTYPASGQTHPSQSSGHLPPILLRSNSPLSTQWSSSTPPAGGQNSPLSVQRSSSTPSSGQSHPSSRRRETRDKRRETRDGRHMYRVWALWGVGCGGGEEGKD